MWPMPPPVPSVTRRMTGYAAIAPCQPLTVIVPARTRHLSGGPRTRQSRHTRRTAQLHGCGLDADQEAGLPDEAVLSRCQVWAHRASVQRGRAVHGRAPSARQRSRAAGGKHSGTRIASAALRLAASARFAAGSAWFAARHEPATKPEAPQTMRSWRRRTAAQQRRRQNWPFCASRLRLARDHG
jgi:hypothetical protein